MMLVHGFENRVVQVVEENVTELRIFVEIGEDWENSLIYKIVLVFSFEPLRFAEST